MVMEGLMRYVVTLKYNGITDHKIYKIKSFKVVLSKITETLQRVFNENDDDFLEFDIAIKRIK